MSYLEEEFRFLLEESKTAESESESAKLEAFPGYSDDVVSGLSKIAKQMISGGYESEWLLSRLIVDFMFLFFWRERGVVCFYGFVVCVCL